MQTPSDIALLQRWQHQQDAQAFRALTQRYGALVFGICNRVLKNAADAEEITQDCFLKLAQDPEKVDRSVGPWLHSVAVNAAISRIRSEQRRRAREAVHEGARAQSTEYAAQDLFEHVDEAISQLPDAQRYCVVAYFLGGKPRQDVAAELGVSTKTVQRKTDDAIEKIREILGQRGITTSAGALATTMAGLKVDALPPALGVALGKIAVAGHAGTAARAVAVHASNTGSTSIVKAAMALTAFAALVSGGIWWTINNRITTPVEETAESQAIDAAPETVASNVQNTPLTSLQDTSETVAEVAGETISIESSGSTLIPVDAISPIANPTDYAELAGFIMDEQNQPIANAEVTLLVAGLPYAECKTIQLEGFPDTPDPVDENLGFRRCNAGMAVAFEATGHQYAVLADEDGAFRIAGIRYRGTALVAARADGYMLAHYSMEILEGLQPEARLTLSPASAVYGQVVDSAGTALAGARVSATGVSKSSGGAGGGGSVSPAPKPLQVTTDAEGLFTLWLAHADRASLLVASDHHYLDAFDGIPVGSEEVQTLTLAVETGALSGQIMLPGGGPASKHFVHVIGMIGTMEERSGRGGQGGFGGGGSGSGGGGFGGGGFGGGSGITGESESADPPVLTFPTEGSRFAVETDAEGRFQLEGMPIKESYAANVYDASGRRVASTALPALVPGEITPWALLLEAPARVAGRVVGAPSGKGLAGVTVSGELTGGADDDDGDLESTATQPDGTFSLDFYSGDGTYELTAFLGMSPMNPAHEKSKARVQLRRDAVGEIVLELPDPWSRRFRAADPTGAPVDGADATLNVREEQGSMSSQTLVDKTDAGGRVVAANLAAGAEMQAAFSKFGYLDAYSSWVKGEAGKEAPEEVVVLYPAASATIRVLDGDGQPLADAKILCTVRYDNDKKRFVEAAADAEGFVTLSECLPAAEINLELRVAAPPGAGGIVYGGSGAMPPGMRDRMAGWAVKNAEGAGTPWGTIEGVELAEGTVNDLGEIRLAESGESIE